MLIEKLARKSALTITPYQPGKPIEEVARELGMPEEDIVKMASNENPLGASPMGIQAIKDAAEKVGLYPDGGCYYLKQDLAKHLDVASENLILGNGSNEVLMIIADTFVNPEDETLYAEQSFVVYMLATKVSGATAVTVPLKNYTHDLEAIADKITDKTKVIFIANPNNPTGTMVTADEVKRFMDRVPDHVIVVFDEAYYEYVERDDFPNTVEYVREGRSVVTLRTFSKIYGLAGLRIGYGITTPEIVKILDKVRQPFNVNAVAQAAAIASLKDKEHVEKSVKVNSEGKKYLYEKLEEMGLEYVPSEGNFMLVHLNQSGADVMAEMLKEGVIVRPMKGYKFPESVRITIGTKEQNDKLLTALKKVLGK
ncbi:histidinol-phosphate transaminase [Candidatus Poribacteria bacterium]|nr:histidinol-phosphate transaminase [Candidatus Poribacteria bacterium]